jgi:hypothetical protein
VLAAELVGAELPADVFESLRRDSAVCRLAESARSGIFERAGREIGGWRGYHLSVRERFRDRARLHLYYLYRYARLATRVRAPGQRPGAADRRLAALRAVLRPFRLGYLYGMRPATLRIAAALAPRVARIRRGEWAGRPSHAPDD